MKQNYYLEYKSAAESELHRAHLASKQLARTDEDRELLRVAYVELTTAIDRWDAVVQSVKDRPR